MPRKTNDSTDSVKLKRYDSIFGDNGGNLAPQEAPVNVPLDKMKEFSLQANGTVYHHPFHVMDDADMWELVADIKENGVLQPGLVRPNTDGGYDIIFGHRRHRACELAGLVEMPVYIKALTDAEAVKYMIGSNLQRPKILPSEKAFAIKAHWEICKHQGERTDLKEKEEKIQQENETSILHGLSERSIQRWITLTKLLPDFLKYLDEGALKITVAYDIAQLNEAEQSILLRVIANKHVLPTGAQMQKMKELKESGPLTQVLLELLLEKAVSQKSLTIKPEKLRSYFPASFTVEEQEAVILDLLREWAANCPKEAYE